MQGPFPLQDDLARAFFFRSASETGAPLDRRHEAQSLVDTARDEANVKAGRPSARAVGVEQPRYPADGRWWHTCVVECASRSIFAAHLIHHKGLNADAYGRAGSRRRIAGAEAYCVRVSGVSRAIKEEGVPVGQIKEVRGNARREGVRERKPEKPGTQVTADESCPRTSRDLRKGPKEETHPSIEKTLLLQNWLRNPLRFTAQREAAHPTDCSSPCAS